MAGISAGRRGQDRGTDSDLESFAQHESGLTVRYSRQLLEEIRTAAVAGLLSIRRGGLEIGGVLFGFIQGSEVTIVEQQTLPIEYVNGPSFLLSSTDEANLAWQIEDSSSDPKLQGMQPVGWYHSHTRSDVSLSAEDIALHERFFPLPQQIALVIRPFQFQPSQVGVFLRDVNHSLHGDAPSWSFDLGSGVRPPRASASDGEPLSPAVESVEGGMTVLDRSLVPLPEPDTITEYVETDRRPKVRRWKGIGLAVVSIALVAAGLALAYWRAGVTPADPMRLRVNAAGDQLTIAWDGDSRTVRQAQAASVSIRDGNREIPPIALDDESVKRGTITYVRQSGDVVVAMRVATRTGGVVEEVARFIGPKPDPPAQLQSKSVEPDAELVRTRAELERVKSELSRMQPDSQRSRLAPESVQPQPTQGVSAAANGRKVLTFVNPTPRIAELKLPESTPIVQLAKPALPGAVLPLPGPAVMPSAPPVQQQRPAVRLATGRAIWTGRLSKGGLLLIEGRRPSAGTLTGPFPQRAARMRVHSADLAQSGIVVYTSSNRPDAVEPPGAANGWNLTTYVVDPKRSRAVTVLESPGQQNGWKPRLLVRGDDRTVSMLVIDWEEISQTSDQ